MIPHDDLREILAEREARKAELYWLGHATLFCAALALGGTALVLALWGLCYLIVWLLALVLGAL